MLDQRVEDIAGRAMRGLAPTQADVEYLLGFDAQSPEASFAIGKACELGMRACQGRGFVFAQIGVDCTPCAKNCRFCSFAAVNGRVAYRSCDTAGQGRARSQQAPDQPCRNYGKRHDWEMPLDDIVHFAELFSDAGAHLVSLMATAQLDFGRYLEMVRAVRECVDDGVVVMANAGDLTLEQARDLKDAGAMAAYHALRLGEGELTGIDPAERRRTIEHLHAAGIPLMTGVEPVWAEVDRAELAARICDIPAFRPFSTGACRLTPIEGADLGGRTPPTPEFLRYVAALTRLACGVEVPIGGVGGVRWVDAGCDPRERDYGSADDHLRRQVARAAGELEAAGFTVSHERPLPLDAMEVERSMATDSVKSHYAEVARMVRQSERDPRTGFHIVRESRAACAIDGRSEAFEIYDERLVEGIPEKALVASRGCADPVSRAELQPGERVLDLGCGGGVDAIIASRLVGEAGQVFGLDMTPEMLALARENAELAGAGNITYIEGLIEDIPLADCSVDVVLSNCVINFSDDREAVLREALRVLAPGGRFVVSDIVEFAPVPAEARADLCAIAGTTNGMLAADDYLELLERVGFSSAELEPKTVYTREVLHEKASRKDRLDHYARIAEADIDSKIGSAIIIARV